MNKNDFLKKLSVLIDDLPKVEKDRILTFYSETLEDHIEEGMTQEEAVASLEDVHEIAEKILMESHIVQRDRMDSGKNQKKTTNRILLLIGSPLWVPILFTCYLLALTAYLLVWVTVVVMYVVVLCFAISAIACLLISLFLFMPHWLSAILALGTGIFFVGLTIVTFYSVTLVSTAILQWSKNMWCKFRSNLKGRK